MQKIIFIEWPSCSWKSTLVEKIMENNPWFFRVNKDKIKFFISNYNRDNKIHRKLTTSLTKTMAKEALNAWLSLVVEARSKLYEDLRHFPVSVYFIDIECDFEDLKLRLKKRVKDADIDGTKLSNKSEERLLEIYNKHKEKTKLGIILNSSNMTEEEIYEEVKLYCKLKD